MSPDSGRAGDLGVTWSPNGHLLGPGDNNDKDRREAGGRVAERLGKPLGCFTGVLQCCVQGLGARRASRGHCWGPCSDPAAVMPGWMEVLWHRTHMGTQGGVWRGGLLFSVHCPPSGALV